MSSSPTSWSRRLSTRSIVLVVLGLAVAAVVATAGVVAATGGFERLLSTDEWVCSDGEAPYAYAEGGRGCAKEGSELPEGATWEPYGNRPMAHSCHLHDDDFVLAHKKEGRDGEDCLPRDGDWDSWGKEWERVPESEWG
jgi:hypothetical protein